MNMEEEYSAYFREKRSLLFSILFMFSFFGQCQGLEKLTLTGSVGRHSAEGLNCYRLRICAHIHATKFKQ
jgi:hypothetical protein